MIRPATLIVTAVFSLSIFSTEADPVDQAEGERSSPQNFEQLPEAQREELREAIRQAWSDPAVVSAREDIRESTEAYQKALREAIDRTNPELSEVLSKMQHLSDGSVRDRLGSRPGPKGGERRPPEQMILPPGTFEKLSEEQREALKRSFDSIRETDEFKAATDRLEKIREQDEAIRAKRIEGHRAMRKMMLEALADEDPKLAERLSRLGWDGPSRGPGGQKGDSSFRSGKGGKEKEGKGQERAPESRGE
ncbi:MAG: hypothetical protein AAF236_10410 [Verrucomicrobiota bacterium]